MSTHNPTPYNMALTQILKEDLHYIQRAASRAKVNDQDLIHKIITNHRYTRTILNEGGQTAADDTNQAKTNIDLLTWMLAEIETCPVSHGAAACPGDSGDIHCILCNKNVLSTDELKKTNWGDLCKTDLENALYRSMIEELERLEHTGRYAGNGHHLAQRLCTMISEELGTMKPRNKGGRQS